MGRDTGTLLHLAVGQSCCTNLPIAGRCSTLASPPVVTVAVVRQGVYWGLRLGAHVTVLVMVPSVVVVEVPVLASPPFHVTLLVMVVIVVDVVVLVDRRLPS